MVLCHFTSGLPLFLFLVASIRERRLYVLTCSSKGYGPTTSNAFASLPSQCSWCLCICSPLCWWCGAPIGVWGFCRGIILRSLLAASLSSCLFSRFPRRTRGQKKHPIYRFSASCLSARSTTSRCSSVCWMHVMQDQFLRKSLSQCCCQLKYSCPGTWNSAPRQGLHHERSLSSWFCYWLSSPSFSLGESWVPQFLLSDQPCQFSLGCLSEYVKAGWCHLQIYSLLVGWSSPTQVPLPGLRWLSSSPNQWKQERGKGKSHILA